LSKKYQEWLPGDFGSDDVGLTAPAFERTMIDEVTTNNALPE